MTELQEAGHKENTGVIKLYSPLQLAFGAFMGGPLAAVYFLRANYVALSDQKKAKAVVSWGIPIYIAVVIMAIFLPSELVTGLLFPILTVGVVHQIAYKTMPDKKSIENDEKLRFQSKRRVFGMSLLIAIVHGLLIVALVFAFSSMGSNVQIYEPSY